MFGQVVYN